MAVREFTDDEGRRWRVWDVVPEKLVPGTKEEDYLADLFLTGWLVFESASGDEKRRLSPFSTRWADFSDEELRQLLGRAEVIRGQKPGSQRRDTGEMAVVPPPASPSAAPTADRRPDLTDLQVTRTFRYPGGRYWTVCVNTFQGGGAPTLRFASGARVIEVAAWPRNWTDYPDERLVELLRDAAPRPRSSPAPGMPRRRWNDPPESTR